MKTIRTKLFLLFAAFMVAMVSCGILLNALFLEEYYIYKNESLLLDAARKIEAEYNGNRSQFEAYLKQMDRLNAINCTITDASFTAVYNSFPQKQDPDSKKLPKELEELIQNNRRNLTGGYIYSVVENPGDQPPKVVLIMRMEDGGYIILNKPLKAIQESVDIANQFYLFAGLLIVLIGSLVILVFSRRLTAPIIEISQVAESISGLDFTKRVRFDSQDELGLLARSVNSMAASLNASLSALREDVERRKQLVRNISHELKTPIGVVKGYAEGLKYGLAEDKERADRYCLVIADECDRMDSLVQELLDLSMMESGSLKLDKSYFNIADLIDVQTQRLTDLLLEKGINLEVECQEGLDVRADYTQIQRVMDNYLTNAINHTGGPMQIKIKANRSAGGVRIEVFNTGKSIPLEELDKIWDVFYKVDKARSRRYSGHGLGLSIVKLIAGLHNGSVGVENHDGGVLFFIDLPVENSQENHGSPGFHIPRA